MQPDDWPGEYTVQWICHSVLSSKSNFSWVHLKLLNETRIKDNKMININMHLAFCSATSSKCFFHTYIKQQQHILSSAVWSHRRQVLSAAETNVFTYRPQLDYNSKRQPLSAHSLWQYDLNFVREAMLWSFKLDLGTFIPFLLGKAPLIKHLLDVILNIKAFWRLN